EVVGARPARRLEGSQDLRDARDALAGQDAVGPAARRLAPVVHVHGADELGVLADVVVQRLRVPEVPDVEGDPERGLRRLLHEVDRLAKRRRDRPLLRTDALERLEPDAHAVRLRLAADPAEAVDDDAPRLALGPPERGPRQADD